MRLTTYTLDGATTSREVGPDEDLLSLILDCPECGDVSAHATSSGAAEAPIDHCAGCGTEWCFDPRKEA